MIRSFLAWIPFIFAWVVAAFCGVYANTLLSQSVSAPWPMVVAFLITPVVFLFVNGFLFNGLLFKHAIEKNRPVFEIGAESATIKYPEEEAIEITWRDVNRVEIVTTSDGPWSEDFWWLFYLRDREEPVDVPQGARGNENIIGVLEEHFEGHNMETVIKALGSTSEARFNVWSENA
jgi:hypothetical protein